MRTSVPTADERLDGVLVGAEDGDAEGVPVDAHDLAVEAGSVGDGVRVAKAAVEEGGVKGDLCPELVRGRIVEVEVLGGERRHSAAEDAYGVPGGNKEEVRLGAKDDGCDAVLWRRREFSLCTDWDGSHARRGQWEARDGRR